jgi:PAS domain S-box-containing protein
LGIAISKIYHLVAHRKGAAMKARTKTFIAISTILIGIIVSSVGMHQANMARNVSRIVFEAAHKHNWFWADGWFELFLRLCQRKSINELDGDSTPLTKSFHASMKMTECFSSLRNADGGSQERIIIQKLIRVFKISMNQAEQVVWITKMYSGIFWEIPLMMECTDHGTMYSIETIKLLSKKHWYKKKKEFEHIYEEMKVDEKLYSELSYEISEKANKLYFFFFCVFCFFVGAFFLIIIHRSHKKSQKRMKNANRILLENEKSLQRAQSIAQIGSWEWNVLSDRYVFSDEIRRVYEIDSTDHFLSIWDVIEKAVHPDDRERVIGQARETWQAGKSEKLTYRIVRKNGEVRWIDAMPPEVKEVSSDGAPASIIGTIQDITESKQAEEEIYQLNQFRELVIDNANIWLNVLDDKANVVVWNKAAEKISGYTREEVIGDDKIWEWSYPDKNYRNEIKEKAAAIMEQNEVLEDFETTIRRKDGKKRNISWHSRKLIDDRGNLIGSIALGRDITERKQAEEALRKSEEKLVRSKKMESLGLLAGGVAHDLNNILSGIVTYPELLLMDLPEDSPLRRPIKTIQESGMKAVDVVADLLTIARGVATGKEALNLNTIVNEYLGSPEYQELEKTHAFVDFKTKLAHDLLNMSGSPIHIKKTLMNLINNASEAIGDSGTVTISSNNRYLDEPLKGYEDVRQGEYVVLSVSDEGSGISPEDLERIFEPFYTKKVMGRSGTGLGLSVVWNTVQDHKGYINVKSSEKGTVFELYFPVTRAKVAAEEEEVPLENYLGHGEKILVVDDEERQREIAGVLLTKLGYVAEAVSNGEEAIEYLKEHPVDLIVLDMVMPKGINGRETYEQIIKIRPGQKAVIASGYAKTKEVDLAQELGAGKYIKKPYTLEKIGVAVKKELGK